MVVPAVLVVYPASGPLRLWPAGDPMSGWVWDSSTATVLVGVALFLALTTALLRTLRRVLGGWVRRRRYGNPASLWDRR